MTIQSERPVDAGDTLATEAQQSIRGLLGGAYPDDDLIFFAPPSLDVAVVGVAERLGLPPAVVYDRPRLIQAFIDDGMDEEEAEEWVSFNIDGAYIGDNTPLLMIPLKVLQDFHGG